MNFKKAIEAKRAAAKSTPLPPKPVSEMTEAELDREEARLQGEVRCLREREIAAQRETVAAETVRRPSSLFKRRRPLWR